VPLGPNGGLVLSGASCQCANHTNYNREPETVL
jgi:hypothetical protein